MPRFFRKAVLAGGGLLWGVFSSAAEPALRVLSPSGEAMTDAEICLVEISVRKESGFGAVVLKRRHPAGMAPCRRPVEGDAAQVVRCEADLEKGRNQFVIYGEKSPGRLVKGPSFRVFRMSPGAPAPALPSTKTPLPHLQPASTPPPAPVEAPPAPPPVREYGAGKCGYPPHQSMSVPVVENGRTRYVSFQTDGNGCLPPQVELK